MRKQIKTERVDWQSILTGLASGPLDSIVKALCSSSQMPSGDHGSMHTLFLTALRTEAKRLRLLLTENTTIRVGPFRELANTVHQLAQHALQLGEYRLGHVTRIQRAFADYRRNPNNFVPLSNRLRSTSGSWGNLLFCLAGEGEFFLTAANTPVPALIHFDQWLDERATGSSTIREELAEQYARRLRPLIAEQYAPVLVTKVFGPTGPESNDMWRAIAKRTGKLSSTYHYDQRTRHGSFREGSTQSTNKFVVLYDLLNTGKALREITRHLKQSEGATDVHFIVLYDYQQRQIDDIGLPSVVDCIFDTTRYPALRLKALREVNASKVRAAPASSRIFHRISLHEVDPEFAADPKAFDDAEWLFRSVQFRRQYAGKWVAARDRQIFGVGASRDDALLYATRSGGPSNYYCHYYHPSSQALVDA